MTNLIYKIATSADWQAATRTGSFQGAAVDLADGFIHFSTASQLRETAKRHFSGQTDLVLAEILSDRLGDALIYEPSRGGELFPHLYAHLPMTAVRQAWPLVIDDGGEFVFPPGTAQ